MPSLPIVVDVPVARGEDSRPSFPVLLLLKPPSHPLPSFLFPLDMFWVLGVLTQLSINTKLSQIITCRLLSFPQPLASYQPV